MVSLWPSLATRTLLDLNFTCYGHRKHLLRLAKQKSVVIPTRQPEDPMSRGGDAHGRSPFYSDGEVGMYNYDKLLR